MSSRALFFLVALILAPFGSAKEVVVVFPLQIPPWVNEDGNGGITVEIVERALAHREHKLVVKYVPFSRMALSIQKPEVDAVAMVEGRKIKADVFYSNVTTKFTTSLISLSKNRFNITDIEQLKSKRVITFLDAKNVFPDMAYLAKSNSRYQELANQQSQVAMLFKQRTDFILVDRNIFNFWRNTLTNVDTSAALTFHDLPSISNIVVESPTHTVFKDRQLRDDFNIGLRQLKNSGEYQQIVNKHLRWCTPAGSLLY